MYIRKIELQGFKSFLNKTTINLERGVTSIVGPNGCGKTNIIDAVRWVLGEQKKSMLRSSKMEDVIFNGTSKLKPINFCQVKLTIENDRKKLPLDYGVASKMLIDNVGSTSGISAMSISDMTLIPRATVIRKCKYLIKNDLIKLNEKKQYVLSTFNFKKILPYQTEAFKFKAKFIRKVLNLLVIS